MMLAWMFSMIFSGHQFRWGLPMAIATARWKRYALLISFWKSIANGATIISFDECRMVITFQVFNPATNQTYGQMNNSRMYTICKYTDFYFSELDQDQEWEIFEHEMQLITLCNLFYKYLSITKTNQYLEEIIGIAVYVLNCIILWNVVQVFIVIVYHLSHCIIPGDGSSLNGACCALKTFILINMSFHHTEIHWIH